MANLLDTVIDGTGYVKLPSGSTAQRPTASAGMVRYNSDLGLLETYNGSSWVSLTDPTPQRISFIDASYRYMGEFGSSANPAQGVIPSTAKAGDLAIAFVANDNNSTSITQSTPPGWTLIGNGTLTELPTSYLYGKILTSGDPGSTLSVTLSSGDYYAFVVAVFRTRYPITSFTTYNFVNQKGPSAYSDTISASGVTAPCLAFASLTGRYGPQVPTLTMSVNDKILSALSKGGAYDIPKIGYKIYESGETPDNIAISVNDTGRQSLSGFYLTVS